MKATPQEIIAWLHDPAQPLVVRAAVAKADADIRERRYRAGLRTALAEFLKQNDAA